MVDYQLLTGDQYPPYERFVLPNERESVRKCLRNNACFAVGAATGDRTLGLAIVAAGRHEETKTGWLHTVNVSPEFRGQSIGTKLVDEALRQARQTGCGAVRIGYGRDYDWSPGLEKILARQDFQQFHSSQIFTIQVNAPDLEKLKDWMALLMRGGRVSLPRSFALIPYKDMSAAMRDIIEAGRDKWFSANVYPFWKSEKINQDRSLILLRDGEPVGWLIICNAGADAVVYRNMLIKKEFRGLGLFVAMLYRGVEWLCDGRKINRAVFNTDTSNSKMLSAITKVLKPCNYRIKTHVLLKKIL